MLQVWGGDNRDEYKILVGNLQGKRSIGRPQRRWKYTIKMDLQEVGWGIDWIWLMIGTGGGLVRGNELPHSIKSGECFE